MRIGEGTRFIKTGTKLERAAMADKMAEDVLRYAAGEIKVAISQQEDGIARAEVNVAGNGLSLILAAYALLGKIRGEMGYDMQFMLDVIGAMNEKSSIKED